MPTTSAARLRRKRRGLEPVKKVDSELSAKRRAAAVARWAYERGEDPEKRRRELEARNSRLEALRSTKPRGWLPPVAEMQIEKRYEQIVLENQQTVKQSVLHTAVQFAPEAVQNLVHLASNAKNEQVRRLASLDILQLAGVMKDGSGAGVKPIQEMSPDELRNFIVAGKTALASLQGDIETVQ